MRGTEPGTATTTRGSTPSTTRAVPQRRAGATRTLRRLLAGLLLVPLLAGCFASRGPGASEGYDSGGGERLRVALAFPPTENYSPYGQDAFILSRLGVSEGLTRLDANGTAVPALATSWTSRNDSRSWLFTLREATFQDGTPVTPRAVASALNHATRAKPQPAALSGVTLHAEPAGGDRVRVTTERPDPVLPQRLSNPSLAVFSPNAYGKNGSVDPVGTATGPFEITETRGNTSATLKRFESYWGGLAHASGIDVTFVADGTARTNALRTGKVDIAEAIPVSQAGPLADDLVHRTPIARTVSLHLNARSGPFTDAGLRAAAREAVDVSPLAENVFEGYADPGEGLFGPALTWAAGNHQEPSGRAEATDPQGTSITLATYNNRPALPETAQVLQQQLERAGFTVKLEIRESSRILADALAGEFDAFVGSRNMMLDTGDPVSVLASDFTCDGDYNLSQLCDPDVERAVTEAKGVTDPGARQEAALAAEAVILGMDAVIPLVHQQAIIGVAASVRGVLFDPYERALVGLGTRR